ncbi:hypothetical protein [Streptomyces sp. NPDC097610]|uniref:hypothetical protein n=1 Tax=Streptomyces sp. NPDC097610 TaxID=3157227 RepID=UPI00331D552C
MPAGEPRAAANDSLAGPWTYYPSAAAQLVNTGRRHWLRLTARWPWTDVITHAIDGLHTLPNPS